MSKLITAMPVMNELFLCAVAVVSFVGIGIT